MKKINEFFGYALYVVGAARMLLVILVLIKMISNLTIIFNGGDASYSSYYYLFSRTVGYAQLILAIGSIVMIILNIKRQPEVIRGYLWGLGAVIIELIIPKILIFYVSIAECGMYMKAGNIITDKNSNYKTEEKTSKKMIENTDWFYSDQSEKSEQMEIKKQKRMAKLEEEICAWKKLLDSGEIDETTYNDETNKLIEKEKRRSERKKL